MGFEVIFAAEEINSPIYKEAEKEGFVAYSKRILPASTIDVFLVDCREISVKKLQSFKKKAPVILIDSSSKKEREIADIVIDMLPSLKNYIANFSPFSATVLGNEIKRRSHPVNKIESILAYVGADKNLLDVVLFLATVRKNITITVLSRVERPHSIGENVIFKTHTSSITEEFENHDAVITYFGVTAFEASSAGLPVATISPTSYHAELAKKCSTLFTNFGYYKDIDSSSLSASYSYFLDNEESRKEKYNASKKILSDEASIKIAETISTLPAISYLKCACGKPLSKIVCRDEFSNIYKCSCNTIKRAYFRKINETYNETYYTSAYKEQYGKTYEEDAPSLRLLARKRLSVIRQYKSFGKVADIGTALGFFLDEARSMGFDVFGCEVSAYASLYASKNLNISVENTNAENFPMEENSLDVVSAWYVLEHIDDLSSLISKIHKSLKKGGVFCFSMPNAFGISGRIMKEGYYKNVPIDHRVEFSPQGIEKYLNSFGFRKAQIIPSGIHFSRFLTYAKMPFLKSIKPLESLYKNIAERFLLGDTFEGYFIKY